jgi:hypothetical protein
MDDNDNQIKITDLIVIKNIIDLACSRGAFRADEMKSIGDVYDKLAIFVNSVISRAEATIAEEENNKGE